MNKKHIELAKQLFKRASNYISNRSCNDWKFPEGWSEEEKKELFDAFHRDNPEEENWYRPKAEYGPPDFWVFDFITKRLIEIAEKQST